MQSLDFFRLNKNGKKVIGPNDELSTHMLREYAKAMRKAQKDGKRAPKSAAESIPFESMEENGLMCLSKKRYSIMLEFSDMNYIQADEHVQKDMWSEWCMLLNSLDLEAEFQMVFFYHKKDVERLSKKLRMEAKDSENKQIVDDLNQFQMNILRTGNKGIEKGRYFLITFSAPQYKAKTRAKEICERVRDEFMDKLEVNTRQLDGYERLSVMFLMLNPQDEKFIFNWDAAKNGGISEKEQLVNHSFVFGKKPDRFMLGSRYGTVSYLKVSASQISDRMFCKFLDVDSEITVSIHFKPISQQKALKDTKVLLSNLQKMKIDEQKAAARQGYGMENVSPELIRNIEAAEKLLDDVSKNDEKLFLVTITFVHVADTLQKLERNFNQARAIANEATCELIKLDHQQEDGFFTSLPLGNNILQINRQMSTTALGAFLPFKIKELFQLNESLCMGYNKETGHIIMADVKTLANPNTLVLGTPGRGKSFLVKMMMLMVYLKLKDDIMICDPEGEYFPLVSKLKGQRIRFAPNSKEYVNPLHIDPDCDFTSEPIVRKCQLVMSIFEQIVGVGKINAYEFSIINRCTEAVYKKFLITRDVNDLPILEDLYKELGKQKEDAAKYLQTCLEVYVYGSLNYFNHRSNVDINNRVVCFDIKELGEQLKSFAMLVVQESVWGRVTLNRSKGKHTRYFIDEFHLLLKDPQTATYSKEIWKRFRKWGGIPVGITQNVSDLLLSPEIQTIFYNSDCYILLGQSAGDADILKESLKLSNEQYKTILTRNKGEGLFIFGNTIIPFVTRIDENTELYRTITTKVDEALK